jgi:hypothetical protein
MLRRTGRAQHASASAGSPRNQFDGDRTPLGRICWSAGAALMAPKEWRPQAIPRMGPFLIQKPASHCPDIASHVLTRKDHARRKHQSSGLILKFQTLAPAIWTFGQRENLVGWLCAHHLPSRYAPAVADR